MLPFCISEYAFSRTDKELTVSRILHLNRIAVSFDFKRNLVFVFDVLFQYENNLLHEAVTCGYSKIVKLLINANADVNARNQVFDQ